MIKGRYFQTSPYFFEGFYCIFDEYLRIIFYIDFSKTYVKQALLSRISSKNRAKTVKIHRLYHKTYACLKRECALTEDSIS